MFRSKAYAITRVLTIGLSVSLNAQAASLLTAGDCLSLQYGFLTQHYSANSEHVDHNYLIDLEYHTPKKTVFSADYTVGGFAFFKNSFGQPSQYVYWGQKWHYGNYFYAKATAGLIHGYHGKYKKKIPFNNKLSLAPAIIPAFGLHYKGLTLEGSLLGTAGFTLALGVIIK